jgi:hypothetical protein
MMSGPRYDADQTTAARRKDTLDLGSVRDDPADVVHPVLEPIHLSVWDQRAELRQLPPVGPSSHSSLTDWLNGTGLRQTAWIAVCLRSYA